MTHAEWKYCTCAECQEKQRAFVPDPLFVCERCDHPDSPALHTCGRHPAASCGMCEKPNGEHEPWCELAPIFYARCHSQVEMDVLEAVLAEMARVGEEEARWGLVHDDARSRRIRGVTRKRDYDSTKSVAAEALRKMMRLKEGGA